MNNNQKFLASSGLAAFALAWATSSEASITGQWDFKQGNINATIGSDLGYYDTPTQTGTSFGTTTSFGISAINGVVTNVMMFPQLADQYGGYQAFCGAPGNGGGSFVNQYTVIMDVLFPAASAGKPRALFVTDLGGEIMVSASDALAINGGVSGGSVTPNAWHRIAVTVDATPGGQTTLYLDGTNVAAQTTAGGLDRTFAVAGYFNLFDDANTNSQSGFVASVQFQDVTQPAGYISALGAPVATGVLTGPPPNPYIDSESPLSDLRFPSRSTVPPNPLLRIVLDDGVATVVPGTVHLSFNGATVTPVVNYAAPVTTITYQVPGFLAPGSSNFVSLTYQDSASDNLGANYSFHVGPYVPLPALAALPNAAVSTQGMIYRVVQAPATASIGNSLVRALQQLDGTLLETNGVPFVNEADLSAFNPDGSLYLDAYEGGSGTATFDYQGAGFYRLPNMTTFSFPGIPGTNSSTDNFADEVVTYLQLNAGSYVFGVNVGIGRVDDPPGADDGYTLFCGANPRDLFSTVVGQFVRTGSNFNDRQNTNEFTFVAPVSGVYPFRLVHWQNNGHADLGWYYLDSTGTPIAVNDSAGPITAYRVSNVPREPYIAEVYPSPGGAGYSAVTPIQVVLSDDDLTVSAASIKLFLNGTQVTPSISKSGKLTSISYNPNANRQTVTNIVQLVYADSSASPKSLTNTWSFTIVVGSATVAAITGQWDFKSGNLVATVGKDLAYLDGPAGTTATLTKFGTCSSFGIPSINGVDAAVIEVPGGPGVNGNNNFGYIMNHQISPNGGGTRVNQYTIIMDMYYQGKTLPFFNCQNTNNTTDGSLFLQNGTMGQGSGGYVMNNGNIGTGWHRIAFSVDLAQNLVTKWVDGVKAQDWVSSANSLDAARRSWQPTVLLFADGDGDDHDATVFLNSLQVRNGRLTDPQMAALGAPDGSPLPAAIPNSAVTGQWDFNNGNLAATIGKDLQYLDGVGGTTATLSLFGTCSTFGIPAINGVDAKVMEVPGGAGVNGNNNFGFIMNHQIGPNGGGTRVNQYTLVMDMYYQGKTLPLINCQNTNNTTDGSLFLQNGTIGQGSGGYVMNHGNIGTGWHRIALAVDLSQNLITKWVDGVKAQDWVSSANGLDAARRSLQPTALLFADGDGDDHDATIFVKSIQISSGKLSDAQMVTMGAPTGAAIPVATPASPVSGQWDFTFGDLSATVGKDLQYLDGAGGTTATLTQFGVCSSFGIPTINGVDAKVMFVPGGAGVNGNNNFGYIMNHQIGPNGGGTRVNQYTLIIDMYYQGKTLPLFNCQNTNNATDGSLFLQNGTIGQGSGGYVMNHGNIGTGWHRIALAVDLSQNLITKWVDGVKAQDWVSSANGLDAARRSLQPTALLFADGDGDDHDASIYVKSIQISNGKMSDAQMVALGSPTGSAIPLSVNASPVTGQWDFNFGDLSATVGKDLVYLDGPAGSTATLTVFGTCSALGIPLLNGVDAKVMEVPGGAGVNGNNNFGYIMNHQIAPNGGGARVNQYTLIMDMYYQGKTLPLFNCQNTNNATDGSIFLQNGTIGQGSGGYVMNNGNITTGWHRIALAADLSQNLITKWVDGVKAQDWVSSANTLDTARRSWQPTVLLFADGDGDDHDATVFVKSIQVLNTKMSDVAMHALGGPSATGIPEVIPSTSATPVRIPVSFVNNHNGTLTISWSSGATGWTLQTKSTLVGGTWTTVTGVVNNSVTISTASGTAFYRLVQ